jgi:hypothetical protein
MKVRTLIAGAAVVLLCGGFGVCVAQEAPKPPAAAAPEAAPSSAPEAAPSSASAPKHHRKHHHRHHGHRHGKQHGAQEFSEQQLQEMQGQTPSK